MLHLSIEHGKILEAMRSDSEVEMGGIIEELQLYDKTFKQFCQVGTITPKDHDLVLKEYTSEWK